MIRIYRIPLDLVEEMWPFLRGYAKKACRFHPFYEDEDLFEQWCVGAQGVFVAADEKGILGFASVEVVHYPRCSVANIVAAGGRKGFLPILEGALLESIEAYGAEQGANIVSAMGRVGWLRIARRNHIQSIPLSLFWKEIRHGRRRQQDYHADPADPKPVGSSDPIRH